MPVTTTRNDAQRRVTMTVTDPWSAEEIAAASDRLANQQAWRYGVVYDIRGTTWVPSEPDMRWLLKHGQQQLALHGARGAVAVLVDDTTDVQLAQQYVQYGDGQGPKVTRVFTDESAANDWLDQQS